MPLYFLMRLQHIKLPLRVIEPMQLRLVSILKATGLIEADIQPELSSTGPYDQPTAATVRCITAAGRTELDNWRGEPRHPGRPVRGKQHDLS